jgi:2-oxoisovalerate dehydrogenase E1 component
MTNGILVENTPTSDALPTKQLQQIYEQALLIRLVEKKFLELFKEGKLFGTVHTCIGQEFSGVAIAHYLQPNDTVFSNHRCHGHFLAMNRDLNGLIAELMGKSSGVCSGKGGSQHLCQNNFFSNGVQGGILPVSAGLALVHRFNNIGSIAVVFMGDGTLGEGTVYETLNLASKWNLPLLIVLEDNLYAQSTSQKQTLAGSIEGRANAFGIKYQRTTTWDLPHLLKISQSAIEHVREYSVPFLLHIDTYRLAAHSKGDDDRSEIEIAEYAARDLLNIFEKKYPDIYATTTRKLSLLIEEAVQTAEQSPFPISPTIKNIANTLLWNPAEQKTARRINELIYTALSEQMEKNSRIILLGEDIEHPYGGAFKVTRDLSARFPDRVRNTPISEATIVGIGNGLALKGCIPICEIMFGDFLLLAADQIVNHAAKFKYMYNEQVTIPLIIRTPMGGRRGYGPTHSQCLEKHFLGIPDTQIIALNECCNPEKIYHTLLTTIDRPTLVIENKLLYAKRAGALNVLGYSTLLSNEPYPTVKITAQNSPTVTVFCYGGSLTEVEKAIHTLFYEHEICVEVICPTRIYPLQMQPLLESLTKTKKLLIFEEGQGFAALGAEVIAQIAAHDASLLSGGLQRIAAAEHPIPASGWLEQAALPQSETIVKAIIKMVQS